MRLLSILFCLFISSITLAQGNNLLTPSVSLLNWVDKEYTIQGSTIRMEGQVPVASFGYRYQFAPGFSVGGDFLYSIGQDFKVVGTNYSGYSNVWNLLVSATYTFNHEGSVQPYLEGGLGYTRISLHSDGPNATLQGVNVHAGLGLNFYAQSNVGLTVGARLIDFDARDDYSGRLDGRYAVYQIGMNIRF